MNKIGQTQAAALLVAGVVLGSLPAHAKVEYTSVHQDFSAAPISLTIDGAGFSFGSTGDIFNPASIETSGTGAVTSFGGFLGIPITPTTDFIDRGLVTYGPDNTFTAFPAVTTIPYSNGDNFIGLEALQGGQSYFGFAYFTNTTLNSYGFETAPGQTITATTAVPEPSTWMLLIAGFGAAGFATRARRKVPAA